MDTSVNGLHYEVSGAGPSVVLLHAGVADSRMWDAQFEALVQRFRVARFDQRGFGQSPLPDGRFSYLEDIGLLIETLGLGRSWLVGASFGGRNAIDFALAHPEAVEGLVLIAPAISGFRPSREVKDYAMREDELVESGELEQASALNVSMWVDGAYRTPEQVDPMLREQIYQMQLLALGQAEPDNAEAIEPEPAIDRLGDLSCPVLVISGALDAPEFIDLAQRLDDDAPRVRRLVVPRTAHMVSMEQPDLVGSEIISWITSHG